MKVLIYEQISLQINKLIISIKSINSKLSKISSQQQDKSLIMKDLQKKLIEVMNLSNKLWQEQGKQRDSIKLLKKGIYILDKLITQTDKQKNQKFKQAYTKKRQQLLVRLKSRDQTQSYSYQKIDQEVKSSQNNQKNKIINSYITCYKPSIKYQNIYCQKSNIDSLRQQLLICFKFPQIQDDLKRSYRPYRGVILYGPGRQKDLLLGACATQCDVNIVSFCLPRVLALKELSQKIKIFNTLLQYAIQKKPSIIYFQDIDIFKQGKPLEDNFQLHHLLIKLLQKIRNQSLIFVVLTTFNIWQVSPYIGKLIHRIYIDAPSFQTRVKIFKQLLKNDDHHLQEKDFQQFANLTENYCKLDISNVISIERSNRIKRFIESEEYKQILKTKEQSQDNQNKKNSQHKKNQGQEFNLKTELFVDKMDIIKSIKTVYGSISIQQLAKNEQFIKENGKYY